MKLNVDISELKLEVAKMNGLFGYLSEIKIVGKSYGEGIYLAKKYVTHNNGEINQYGEVVHLKLYGEEARCFPSLDSEDFNFEM